MTQGSATTTSRRSLKLTFITVLMIALSLAINLGVSAYAADSITGIVQDNEGAPLEGAEVSLWLERELVASCSTRSEGLFEFDAEIDEHHTLYVLADDESTPGVDYLPSRTKITPSDGDRIIITLPPAASMILEGDIQFVESEELPISVLYAVLDSPSGLILERGGFPMVYGSAFESQSHFIGLEHDHIVVPANELFKVRVNCSVLVKSNLVTRSFEVDEPGQFILDTGERVVLDLRSHSIPYNLDHVESLLESVNENFDKMDAYGFYIATEKEVTTSAVRWLSEARYLLEEGLYIESFDACKRGYIELAQTKTHIAKMVRDASLSIYSIIVFLALASTAIAFLISNRDSTKALGSIAVYASTLVVLYLAYPGSVIVPPQFFAGTGLLAIALSLMTAIMLPHFLKGRGGDAHVPVRNIIVPIFSLAKRSIRRRRLRFALTLTSITVLVMSFVSLTSFSEGYGLIVTRVSGRTSSWNGVFLRAKGYTEMEPSFLSQKDVASGWLERQPESVVVSPKAESLPMTQPLTTLNGLPIWGVIGFDSTLETAITEIADALEDGMLPSEGGVVISETLRDALGVELGDRISLSCTHVRLDGVLDDDALQGLKEIDGSSYLPGKLVNLSPDGEVPSFVLEPCEPSKAVILPLSMALRIPLVGISRVAITVREGVDVEAFAERLALERGYWALSAGAEGIYLARLGSYLEGKGLPLMVPWCIVVLNVVVTMLNSLYERRREIHILSSVGLNPAQIAAVFVAEATMIGLTAGGLGYLAGLGLYRGMAFFDFALEVQQKVSAFWSLASIGIAMTSVLMGAFVALRASVVITPSLMRRWRIEDREIGFLEPWEITIPLKLLPEEIDGFVDFTVNALKSLEDDPIRSTSSIKVLDGVGAETRINFVYKATQSTVGNFYTKNTILIEKGTVEGGVVIRLRSYGEQDWAHATGSLIRMITMRWSTTPRLIGSR